ncbi:MAG: hypothetical protein IPJ06_05850 [Saprospiraceae bacterium]|nr:hypothetical protein [Saprospiraceae bacterium]
MTSMNFFRFGTLIGSLILAARISTAQPVLSTADSPAIKEPTMWAVVIGVSKYRDPAVRPLQYAHADAQAFADYLHSSAAGDMKKYPHADQWRSDPRRCR